MDKNFLRAYRNADGLGPVMSPRKKSKDKQPTRLSSDELLTVIVVVAVFFWLIS